MAKMTVLSPKAWMQASSRSSREAAFPSVKDPMTSRPTWPHWNIQLSAIRQSTLFLSSFLFSSLPRLLSFKCAQCAQQNNGWLVPHCRNKQNSVNYLKKVKEIFYEAFHMLAPRGFIVNELMRLYNEWTDAVQ